jgi:hypothetical protein
MAHLPVRQKCSRKKIDEVLCFQEAVDRFDWLSVRE